MVAADEVIGSGANSSRCLAARQFASSGAAYYTNPPSG